MAVFRVDKSKNYTTMSNYHLKEKEMSLKAIGLLSKMLSLPDDWDYSLAGLISICKENETAVKSALHELQYFGYLEVIKKYPNETESGRIEYEYIIHEKPIQEGIVEGIKEEKQPIENLSVENQVQLNTKELNTKNKNNIYSPCTEHMDNETSFLLNKKCKEIIDYLNNKLGTEYKYTSKATQKHIHARLKEQFTIDDFKKVINKKYDEWYGTDMQQYLRPETLFGTKFESYLNAPVKNQPQKTKWELVE